MLKQTRNSRKADTRWDRKMWFVTKMVGAIYKFLFIESRQKSMTYCQRFTTLWSSKNIWWRGDCCRGEIVSCALFNWLALDQWILTPLLSILTLGKYDNDSNWYPSWCVETSWNSLITIGLKAWLPCRCTVLDHSLATSIWVMQRWQPPPTKPKVWD